MLQPFWDQHLKGCAGATDPAGLGLRHRHAGVAHLIEAGRPTDRSRRRRHYLPPGGRLLSSPNGPARVRRICLRPGQAGALSRSAGAGHVQRRVELEQLAGRRSTAVRRRTDVLTFVSEPLTEPLTISGEVAAKLYASTTGTDSDWVVKLIDVFPPEVRANGARWLPVDGLRRDPARPLSGQPRERPKRDRQERWRHIGAGCRGEPHLPRGHRIMVQVQSSWFPLYDRNPQTFVENIAKARPGDYRAATQRIWFAPGQASFVELPVVDACSPRAPPGAAPNLSIGDSARAYSGFAPIERVSFSSERRSRGAKIFAPHFVGSLRITRSASTVLPRHSGRKCDCPPAADGGHMASQKTLQLFLGIAVAAPANAQRVPRSAPLAGRIVSTKAGSGLSFSPDSLPQRRSPAGSQDRRRPAHETHGDACSDLRGRTQVRLGRNAVLVVKAVTNGGPSALRLESGTFSGRTLRGQGTLRSRRPPPPLRSGARLVTSGDADADGFAGVRRRDRLLQ